MIALKIALAFPVVPFHKSNPSEGLVVTGHPIPRRFGYPHVP